MTEYNPARHITAAELIAEGVPIPSPIPAAAFIRRGSYSVNRRKSDDTEPLEGPRGPGVSGDLLPKSSRKVVMRMTLACREPFRLNGMIYAVDPDGNIRIEKEKETDG